jgi:hypothetical protein
MFFEMQTRFQRGVYSGRVIYMVLIVTVQGKAMVRCTH